MSVPDSSQPDHELVLSCRFCGAENSYDGYQCNGCDRPLVVAHLEAHGDGVMPGGYLVPLARRDYHLGRQIDNDVVVPCQAADTVRIAWVEGDKFVIYSPENGLLEVNQVRVNERLGLTVGDEVRIGLDTFTFLEGTPDCGLKRFGEQDAQDAQLVLNAAYLEIARANDLNHVCAITVDAVLRITGMDRGVFFLTDTDEAGELILQQCVTREASNTDGFTDVDSPFQISQSLLRQSLINGGTIVIDDARKRPQTSESMVALNLSSIACLPIVYSEQQTYTIEDCIGIIYADSFMPSHDLGPHVGPLLTTLASYLSSIIMHWR